MLLDNDIVTDGEAKAGPFSCGFRCEEGIEHLLFHFRWNTVAVVANPDFYAIAHADIVEEQFRHLRRIIDP